MLLKKLSLIISAYLISSSLVFANLDLITWKGTYYDPIPNQVGISQDLCNKHNPGSFIHVVKDALAHPIYTDRGIKLDRATFHVNQEHGIYLIKGDFWASGKINGQPWEDHIYYYLSKLTESGKSHGVWASSKCKGFYLGVAIKNNNTKA